MHNNNYHVKKNKGKIGWAIIALGALAVLGSLPGITRSASNHNVHGFLWSYMPDGSDENRSPSNAYAGQGLGWISMNSDDSGTGAGSVPYGVALDPVTGKFSGSGWGEYSGWLELNPSGPFPRGSGNQDGGASVDPTCISQAPFSCPIRGWARFSSQTGDMGGWDRWVSLQGTTSSAGSTFANTYGWKITSTNQPDQAIITGFAWGGDVAGWISAEKVTVDLIKPQQDMCPDESNYPGTIGLQAVIPNGWHLETVSGQFAQVCRPDKPIPGCIADATALNNGTPQGANVHDQSMCDFCAYIPGIQTPQAFQGGMTYNNIVYGPAGGYCQPDVCPDVPGDVITSGFQAGMPVTTINGVTYTYAIINGICQPSVPCTGPACVTPGGPIKPIYKEN